MDISGSKVGQLKVWRKDEEWDDKHDKYLCLCDCGVVVAVSEIELLTEVTTNCGHVKAREEWLRNNLQK